MAAVTTNVPFMPTTAMEEKTLRSSFIREEGQRPTVAYNDFNDDIPVISLDGIHDEKRRVEICQSIVKACEEWGLFQVVDHGIDSGLISDMARFSKEFFSLSPEEKLKFDAAGKKGGFLISSHLKDQVFQDWREFFLYFCYPTADRDYSRWPEKPEGWTPVVEKYSEALMGLACKLLEVLSEAMGLDKEALTKACVNMDQKVLINFYPKCPQPDLTFGLRPHTDPGTITLLLQDDVGGLQATKDGGNTWVTVKPIPNAYVVNLGDHCMFMSNGRFKNALHQAVVNSKSSRLSIATFQNPSQDATVYPLAIGEGEKAILEEPISFKEMYTRKMDRDAERGNKLTYEQNNKN